MAFISSTLLNCNFIAYGFFMVIIILNEHANGCYTSIFGFGDSLTDTGNLVRESPPNDIPHMGFPPYGETYFHRPTGRCSDGRLVIDFLAEYFGVPLVPPSAAVRKGNSTTVRGGVNFAVVGAPALDLDFYAKQGIHDPLTNDSLRIQLNQFKAFLPTLCDTPSSCKRLLRRSLILLGPFGGNDYTHSVLSGKSFDEILPFVPLIATAIASATAELIELGATTIVVPGILPMGCVSAYLTQFETSNTEEYDTNGCIIWLNKWTEHHNELLQTELQRTRELHPHATIIYADYYNASMQLFRSPTKYGFRKGAALRACCGGGGRYNYNSSAQCGFSHSTGCQNPSLHVNWDGYHFTEAAYRLISTSLLEGPYMVPPISTTCLSFNPRIRYYNSNHN